MTGSLPSPGEALELSLGYYDTATAYVAARLRTADVLGDRPQSVDELAGEVGSDAISPGRLSRSLTVKGVFQDAIEGILSSSPMWATPADGLQGSVGSTVVAP